MLRLGWREGVWGLLCEPRVLRVIAIANELRELRCGYHDQIVFLVDVYRRLTVAVESHKLKFRDASKLLMSIEDFFDHKPVLNYIQANSNKFSQADFYFMKARGLVSDD